MGRATEFAEGLRDHQQGLTAYCARLLWRREDLEDAPQETLMVAFRQFGRRMPPWELRAWIYRIATFTCFTLNRRRAASPKPLDPSLWTQTIEDELEREYTYEEILKSPSNVLEALEPEIARACAELNDNERAILLLKTIGGFTCAEIASILSIPLGTSQGPLTRARMKMRQGLSEFARERGYLSARKHDEM